MRCPSLAERQAAFPATEGLDSTFAYEAGAWAPILTEHEALGFLSVHHRAPTDLTPDELALVEAAAQMCSQALVRARLYEREAAARDVAERPPSGSRCWPTSPRPSSRSRSSRVACSG